MMARMCSFRRLRSSCSPPPSGASACGSAGGKHARIELLPALCKALGIDIHEHHTVTGIDKAAVKSQMRELKKQRAAALEAQDHAQLKSLRRQIHRLNHQIRAHMA